MGKFKDLYKHCLEAFTRVAKPKRVIDVTHSALEDFATDRLREGVAIATVNRDLRHVRAAVRWALRRKLLSDVPDFKGVFIKEDRKRPTIIPESDFIAMIDALKNPELKLRQCSPDWWRIFLYIAYYLGLRRGEALGLSWEDINFDSLEIRVLAPTSKARKERVLPIPKGLDKILQTWREISLKASGKSPVLPWNYDTYRQIYDDWHRIQTAAGIPEDEHYVPKNCRSSCASHLIASDVPTAVVKDWLGHANVATTENYYINTKPALRAAANARKSMRMILPQSESSPWQSNYKMLLSFLEIQAANYLGLREM